MSDTPTEAELREAFNASSGIAPNSACRLGNWKECFDAFKRGAQYERERHKCPTANSGVETPSPAAKGRQGAGERAQ